MNPSKREKYKIVLAEINQVYEKLKHLERLEITLTRKCHKNGNNADHADAAMGRANELGAAMKHLALAELSILSAKSR